MNTTNKTDPKAITTTETAKDINKPVISTQPEIKKQVDIKKPEMPEKTPITDDKQPTAKLGQNILVVTKPDSATAETTKVINKPVITTEPELKKPTIDVQKPALPETAPISNEKDPIVPVYIKPEPPKTESINTEKSKNLTKSDIKWTLLSRQVFIG